MNSHVKHLRRVVLSKHPHFKDAIHDDCIALKRVEMASRSYYCGGAIRNEVQVLIDALCRVLDTLLQEMKLNYAESRPTDTDVANIATDVLAQLEQEALDAFRKVDQDRFFVGELALLTEKAIDQQLGEFRYQAHQRIREAADAI